MTEGAEAAVPSIEQVSQFSTAKPKPPWRRIHKPSLFARAVLLPFTLGPHLVALVLGFGTLEQGGYLTAVWVLALLQLFPGVLMRALRWQGLSINPEGDVRLASVFGQREIAKDRVDRILIDPDCALVYVWTGGQVLWLEVGSRLGIALPGRKRLAATYDRLRGIYGDRVSLGELTREEAINVVSMEFSFKGFSRILASPLVWVPALLGQVLLFAARG